MILIGLHGQKRGKATVARYLVDQYGFAEVMFAAPIKRALATMLGLDIDTFEREDLKEAPIEWLNEGRERHQVEKWQPPITPCFLLQTLGTEWGRKMMRADLWLILAARAIDRHRAMGHPGVVVSDVEDDTQAKSILERGGELWGVSGINRVPDEPCAVSTSLTTRGIINHISFGTIQSRVDHLLGERAA